MYNNRYKDKFSTPLSIMSFYTLNERIKIDFWSDFKAVYQEIKAIAETVRTENRRVNKPMTAMIVVRPIKDIIAPISRIFNYRYADDTLRDLLSSAVQRLQLLALEIESFYEKRFVSEFRRLASTLVSFLPQGEGVQLTILDAEKYHDPNAAKRKLPCFYRWYNGILAQISRHFRDKSMKVGFSNPYINCGKIPHTQLSIPFHRANLEAAKKRYMAAYFDIAPASDEADTLESTTPEEEDRGEFDDLSRLGLRTLRKVAGYLGVAQKVEGKDRSKASFIEEIESLLKTNRDRVLEAIAAVG